MVPAWEARRSLAGRIRWRQLGGGHISAAVGGRRRRLGMRGLRARTRHGRRAARCGAAQGAHRGGGRASREPSLARPRQNSGAAPPVESFGVGPGAEAAERKRIERGERRGGALSAEHKRFGCTLLNGPRCSWWAEATIRLKLARAQNSYNNLPKEIILAAFHYLRFVHTQWRDEIKWTGEQVN